MPETLDFAMDYMPTFLVLIYFHLSFISKEEENLEMVTFILFSLYSLTEKK